MVRALATVRTMPEPTDVSPDRGELRALRQEYAADGPHEAALAPDPWTMFGRWFDDARAAGLHEPNAVVVATVSADGVPAARTVLLKGLDDGAGRQGFVFYTNHGSRKGADLEANPRAALLFPWHPLERQVRVDGVVERLPRELVAAYFAERPRGSQLGAWASAQSSVVAGREELEAAYAAAEARFAGATCRCPTAGAATSCCPRPWSSGRAGPAACTTGWSTAAPGRVGWSVERLAP